MAYADILFLFSRRGGEERKGIEFNYKWYSKNTMYNIIQYCNHHIQDSLHVVEFI